MLDAYRLGLVDDSGLRAEAAYNWFVSWGFARGFRA